MHRLLATDGTVTSPDAVTAGPAAVTQPVVTTVTDHTAAFLKTVQAAMGAVAQQQRRQQEQGQESQHQVQERQQHQQRFTPAQYKLWVEQQQGQMHSM